MTRAFSRPSPAIRRPPGALQPGPDQEQRQLVGQQFVIGQALARQRLRRQIGFMGGRVRRHQAPR